MGHSVCYCMCTRATQVYVINIIANVVGNHVGDTENVVKGGRLDTPVLNSTEYIYIYIYI